MLRLASGSPRRLRLVRLLGIDYESVPADIDETAYERPALAKARAVALPGGVTLAADTMIDFDGERIGKPRDAEAAVAMLRRFAGRWHEVRTEVAVIGATGRALWFAVRSRVAMRERDDAAIANYVATGEPLDKAGAYAIQGKGGELVESFEGCFANIIGLPLCHTFFALRKAGVVMPVRPEDAFAAEFGFTCPAWRCAELQGRYLHDGAEYRSWSERLA